MGIALLLKSEGYYPAANFHYATNWSGKSQKVGYWLRMRLMIEILSIILSRALPHLNYEIAPSAACRQLAAKAGIVVPDARSLRLQKDL